MKKTRIVVIDSGISEDVEYIDRVTESYIIQKCGAGYDMVRSSPRDLLGHGTSVSYLINREDNSAELINIMICDETHDEIDELGLLSALGFIYHNLDVDIICISAGLIYIDYYVELKEICEKLRDKGIIIVAAFDNAGAVSYPAALDSVIGVAIDSYATDKNMFWMQNSIINVMVSEQFYRTIWKGKRTILRGTSYACAQVVGLISKVISENKNRDTPNDMIKGICNDIINLEDAMEFPTPSFEIHKAVIFPLNKETNALIRFKDLLSFALVGVYDERVTGQVGRKVLGETILSFDELDWKGDFDTIILSCSKELSNITKRDYQKIIIENAREYSKNIYSFEKSICDYDRYFYPGLEKKMVPKKNCGKLHKISIPIVGVFGTSSKQGKYSLQLQIIRELKRRDYNVGSIATEPSGYLFDCDYVYHFGYGAERNLTIEEMIAVFNEMIWNVQKKNKDILITGCQSGTIHYDISSTEDFLLPQYAFALGCLADYCILCVNPHDDLEYIDRTIGFINSIDQGKVEAIVLYPFQVEETIAGINYRKRELSEEAMQNKKAELAEKFQKPAYALNCDADIAELCTNIIEEFRVV